MSQIFFINYLEKNISKAKNAITAFKKKNCVYHKTQSWHFSLVVKNNKNKTDVLVVTLNLT